MPGISSRDFRSNDAFERAVNAYAQRQPERVATRESGEVEERINRQYDQQRTAYLLQHGLLSDSRGQSGETPDAMSRLFTLGDGRLRGRG